MKHEVRIARAEEYAKAIPRLAEILIDAVASGAGVSFIAPPTQEEAEWFWKNLSRAIETGETICFLAELEDKIAGVVLLMPATALNQPHRADIAKLLVHRKFRRQGIGSKLMTAAETHARNIGLKLITFDAVAHGAVEDFYKDLGFVVAGYYPKYAYALNHRLDDTALFFKEL